MSGQSSGSRVICIDLDALSNIIVNSLQCIQDVSKECVEFRQQCRKLKKDLTVSNETNEILLAEMDKLEAALSVG